MNVGVLLALATSLSLACGWPAGQTEQLQQDQLSVQQDQLSALQDQVPNGNSNGDAMASLSDVADLGSQHEAEGSRKARFLWGGLWGYPRYYHYYPSYSYSYYRPWGHRYWW